MFIALFAVFGSVLLSAETVNNIEQTDPKGYVASCQSLQSFLQKMTPTDRSILEWFFRNCLQSFGGYVLFGDKPMSIESCASRSQSLKVDVPCAKARAFEILKGWQFSGQESPYLFLFHDNPNYSNMFMINRKACIKAINDNLSLFRYILGRHLSTEEIFEHLVHDRRCWEALNRNDTLIGILLGYGTENALIYSRSVEISQILKATENKVFPYVNGSYQNSPMSGFSSMIEEQKYLDQMVATNSRGKEWRSYEIPMFGCVAGSEETNRLLAMYEANREQILQAAHSENFLETVLTRIFTTESGELKLPILPAMALPLQNAALEVQLADVLKEELTNKKHRQAFLQGMDESPRDEQFKADFQITTMQLESLDNLLAAQKGFEQFAAKKGVILSVPQGIGYKVLKKGKGVGVTLKSQNFSFHLSYRPHNQAKMIDYTTIKNASFDQLIPGVAHALIGMKRGEQRLIYIHPRFAYGISSLPNNMGYIAEVQLIDFEEGTHPFSLPGPQEIELTLKVYRNGQEEDVSSLHMTGASTEKLQEIHRILLAKMGRLKEEEIRDYGARVAQLIPDREKFIKSFQSRKKYFKNREQRERFLVEFQSSRFVKELQEGKVPPYPFSWL